MSKTFTAAEVAKHNSDNDCWIIIDGKVYDVTKFLDAHPGGKKVITNLAGKDTSAQFKLFHKPSVLAKYGPDLYIGDLAAEAAPAEEAKKPAAAEAKRAVSPRAPPAPLPKHINEFGEGWAYCDPNWYQGWNSPYYNDSHRRFRAALRDFVEKEIMPFVHEWDEAKALPKELWKKASAAGFLPCAVGWPKEFLKGKEIMGGVKPEEYDMFHSLILSDELCRAGSGGLAWGLFGGLSIGLPPVLHFASQELKDRIVPGCLTGDKMICLAITEPYAGSDVAGLRTTARLSPCGKYYIVNGEKKWITNGIWADYFTTAVRTGGPGMGGISLLLIERAHGGVNTRQMQCSGVWSSGTTYITFEDVKVPVENLIGKENHGFKYIMYNFNSERWGSVAQAVRLARVCFEDAMKYATQRETFGKKLIEHPVIRNKLAHMARQIESAQSWLEAITYQFTTMSQAEANRRLGGPIALAKAHASQVLEYCAREAAQIFGGLAYTRGGQGERVERIYREVRAFAIPAGSEEIMLDLGIRQAMRDNPKL